MTQPHVVQPPPTSDQTNQAIVQILEMAATYEAATAALAILLRPWKLSAEAIATALRLSSRRTGTRPRPRGQGPVARAAARSEAYYRAAYLLRAAGRIQDSLDAGLTLRQALGKEKRFWEQHEQARRIRQDAVKRDLHHADLFGPVLGWYLNPLLNNEEECIAANGHNYVATEGTVIGRPGAVHSGCGCTSGPPIEGAGWVNDAVKGHIILGKPKRFKRKAA